MFDKGTADAVSEKNNRALLGLKGEVRFPVSSCNGGYSLGIPIEQGIAETPQMA